MLPPGAPDPPAPVMISPTLYTVLGLAAVTL